MNAKNLFLSLLCLPMLVLTSCERDLGSHPTLSSEPTAPVLTASSSQWILSKDRPLEVTFSWEKADLGQSVPVSYALVISNPSDKELSIQLPIPAGEKELKVALDSDLNKQFVKVLKLDMAKPSKVMASLVASPLLESGTPEKADRAISSKPIELTVTPFAFLLRPPYFYLVGDITGKVKWDINSKDFAFFADENDTKVLHYYGYFKEGAAFKLVPEGAVGDWNKVVGMKDGKLTMEGGETDIKIIKKAGLYHLTLTLNEGTFDPAQSKLEVEPLKEEAKSYANVGLVGDAGKSWNEDILFSNPGDDHIWVARGVMLKEGAFKLRADKAWGMSWGGAVEGSFPTNFGISISSGAKNWGVTTETAGKYDIYFNDLTGHYVFVKL